MKSVLVAFASVALVGFPSAGQGAGADSPSAVVKAHLAGVAAVLNGWSVRVPPVAVTASRCKVADVGQPLARVERIFNSPPGGLRQQVDATVEVRVSPAPAAKFVEDSVDAKTMACTRMRLKAAVEKAYKGSGTLEFIPSSPTWLKVRGVLVRAYQLKVSHRGTPTDFGVVAVYQSLHDKRVVYVLANDQIGSAPRALTLRLVAATARY